MKTLIVITGPTASGKSAIALELAKILNTSIISADSRQIYRNLPIGTAAPSEDEQAAVPHFFVGILNLEDYYSASMFEQEALKKIEELFKEKDYLILCGGSMMYIDAVVNGLDDLPTISDEVRKNVISQYERYGIDYLLDRLEQLDPVYFAIVDKNNHKRVIHAIEIIEQSGRTYSSLRTNSKKVRNFNIVEFAVEVEREELYKRINDRVDRMLAEGFEAEARNVEIFKNLNSLNTVGYKELFAMFDGKMTKAQAIEKIKRNTRVYAKKQLAWLKKRKNVHYITKASDIIDVINPSLSM